MFDLYLITPERDAASILSCAQAALAGAPPGRVGVQLRSKSLAPAERAVLARALRELTRGCDAALLINGDLELARAVGADGVQLPEHGTALELARARLGAAALIGASRHDLAGVQAAQRDGTSFVVLAPVFAVPDKGTPLGLAAFADIARASRGPVFALGGIDVARSAEVIAAGAHGIAVMREVWDSAQPARAVAALIAALDAAR